MPLRSVLEEYEAHLFGAASEARAKGKAERKRYGNGEERLKLRASGLTASDGTRVDVRIGADVIGRAAVEGGRVSFELASPGAHVPAVAAGHALTLVIGGRVVLSGEFRPE
jgi:hypothetical protein